MLCEAAPDIEVGGAARNGSEAIRRAGEHRPDVILMDLRMPVMDGTTATKLILPTPDPTRIVILTTSTTTSPPPSPPEPPDSSPRTPTRLSSSPETASPPTVTNPYSTKVLRRIGEQLCKPTPAATELEPEPVMTPRERDVALLGEGPSNKESPTAWP